MADEADLPRAATGPRAAARARAAGAVLQGLVLGFLVVLAGMELNIEEFTIAHTLDGSFFPLCELFLISRILSWALRTSS